MGSFHAFESGKISLLFYLKMYISKNSYAKINITLRVTGIRNDGYHNIFSLFSRINASERLHIRNSDKDCDIVNSPGMLIEGENIVAKALRIVREYGFNLPFLDISVYKTIPPGTGLGGGSGNAGAILDFIGAELPLDVVLKIGADVPFFYKNYEIAIISGIGGKIEPIDKLQLNIAIIVPKWNSVTKNAYKMLDMYWLPRGGYPLDENSAKNELYKIYSLLASNRFVGFLPNDFAPLLIEENALYEKYFDIFYDSGALAWGITGSGASMFVLYSDKKVTPLLLDKIQAYEEFIDKVIIC